MPCRVAYQTHKHNTAVPHNSLHASLPVRTSALRGSFLRARVITNSIDVGTFSIRCEHSEYQTWVPMPVLRKADVGAQSIHAGVQSTHLGTHSSIYPCEYSE